MIWNWRLVVRKWVSYLIPLLTIILFIVVMEGGYYYVTSLDDRNTMPDYIQQVNEDLRTDQWDDARESLDRLELEWNKNVPRIQYHAEMDAIENIEEDIARLKGAIDAQDLGLSLAEISALSEHWENLTN